MGKKQIAQETVIWSNPHNSSNWDFLTNRQFGYKHTFFKIVVSTKHFFSLHFRSNTTCLSVGLLMICEAVFFSLVKLCIGGLGQIPVSWESYKLHPMHQTDDIFVMWPNNGSKKSLETSVLNHNQTIGKVYYTCSCHFSTCVTPIVSCEMFLEKTSTAVSPTLIPCTQSPARLPCSVTLSQYLWQSSTYVGSESCSTRPSHLHSDSRRHTPGRRLCRTLGYTWSPRTPVL